MKILFICSSLEPGKDGVGDYTRKLSAALYKKGNGVLIAGINDRYLNDESWAGEQHSGSVEIRAVRLASLSDWDKKTVFLNNLIQEFKPDWVSLQYVPYGFNKKGIPFYLPSILQTIKGNFKWHIMFHEMWVGNSPTSPFMHKVYGFFQRKIAKAIVNKLNPTLIHTSNLLYQQIQQASGINSEILPLFSNIQYSLCDATKQSAILDELTISASERNSRILIGIFGHLYSIENIYAALEAELKKAASEHKKLCLISFGKINSFEKDKLNALKKIYPELDIKISGEKTEAEISCILQVLDKGLSCTPYELIGKSGAFAAMKRHNLEIIVPALITMPVYKDSVIKYNTQLENREPEKWDVSCIAEQFTKDLEKRNGA